MSASRVAHSGECSHDPRHRRQIALEVKAWALVAIEEFSYISHDPASYGAVRRRRVELRVGLRSIAVPLQDGMGEVLAAVEIAVPAEAFPSIAALVQELAPALRALGEELQLPVRALAPTGAVGGGRRRER
jgi:hypothetical protein